MAENMPAERLVSSDTCAESPAGLALTISTRHVDAGDRMLPVPGIAVWMTHICGNSAPGCGARTARQSPLGGHVAVAGGRPAKRGGPKVTCCPWQPSCTRTAASGRTDLR